MSISRKSCNENGLKEKVIDRLIKHVKNGNYLFALL